MSTAMKQQDGTDRRKTDRQGVDDRRSGVVRASSAHRELEHRGLAESMVDALEDILKWERASERELRVAVDTTSAS